MTKIHIQRENDHSLIINGIPHEYSVETSKGSTPRHNASIQNGEIVEHEENYPATRFFNLKIEPEVSDEVREVVLEFLEEESN